MTAFTRKIYTAGTLFMDLGHLIAQVPKMAGALRDERIGRAFREKIMLVVTAVNGCTYCSWFHAKLAVVGGMSAEEVRNLLDLQFHAHADDFELPGLLYAQHYAETDRHPDPEMTRELLEHYGERTAGHIRFIIRSIFFGNLSGNTFDAFLSRLAGAPPERSNALFEFLFFLLTAPVLLPARVLTHASHR